MDNYLYMLFDLQTEKCNKIILLPGLRELKRRYDIYSGSMIKLMQNVFSGIFIDRSNGKK